MTLTSKNHAGKFNHASADAMAAMREVEKRFNELQGAFEALGVTSPGAANRLNDFARDLEHSAHNLVHFLNHAGSI